jgi:serine protease AprX
LQNWDAPFVDELQGLKTGEQRQYNIQLDDASVPLRVTLVYNDFPGEKLINNLNLLVYDPSGKYYFGNDFKGIGIPDSLNNVEGVVIEQPATGSWSVKIVASEVLQGLQDFALVISGGNVSLQQ